MSSVHSVTHVLGSYRSRASSPGETPAGDDCQKNLFGSYLLLSLSQIDMSMAATNAAPQTALAAELAKVLARIGRGLRYRTRAVREALDITHSEGELLRLLDRRPGIRVQAPAAQLGTPSNPVPT